MDEEGKSEVEKERKRCAELVRVTAAQQPIRFDQLIAAIEKGLTPEELGDRKKRYELLGV